MEGYDNASIVANKILDFLPTFGRRNNFGRCNEYFECGGIEFIKGCNSSKSDDVLQ